jgi:hypothetical protein
MKVELLRLDSANKSSPISEGVAEIRINSQPCKGINLTTWHTQARRAPRVATVHDDYQRVEPGPPYRSAVFHAYASADTPLVSQTLSHCTPMKYDGVSSNSATVESTHFVGLHISRMRQYIIKCLFVWTQSTRALIDTSGGYHLQSSELTIDLSRPSHMIFSTFP